MLLVFSLLISFMPVSVHAGEEGGNEKPTLISVALLSVWTSADKEVKVVDSGTVTSDTVVSDGKGGTATYDANTNTLTLDNFNGYSIYAKAMGKFTLHVKGNCSLNGDKALSCALALWLSGGPEGNLTVSADPGSKLTLAGPDAHGMYIDCLSANIEKDVNIDISAVGGGDRALVINETPSMTLAGKIKAIGATYGVNLNLSDLKVTGSLEVGSSSVSGGAMLIEAGSKLTIDKGDFILGQGKVTSKGGSSFTLVDSNGVSSEWKGGSFSGGSNSETPEPPAKPAVKKITVKLHPNKGKLAKKSQTKIVQKGKKYGKLAKPKRTGYKFKGWYTKKSGGSKVTSKSIVKSTSNTKHLYAHWAKNTKK
jgi:uncharacterized repeat protein (TIGR02543 family)